VFLDTADIALSLSCLRDTEACLKCASLTFLALSFFSSSPTCALVQLSVKTWLGECLDVVLSTPNEIKLFGGT